MSLFENRILLTEKIRKYRTPVSNKTHKLNMTAFTYENWRQKLRPAHLRGDNERKDNVAEIHPI